MKTKEELNAIKEDVETMNKKLQELTEDELKQVVGGHAMGPEVSGVIGTAVAPSVLIDTIESQPSAINPTIDPADIESMEILKDAASTTIYGSRGK